MRISSKATPPSSMSLIQVAVAMVALPSSSDGSCPPSRRIPATGMAWARTGAAVQVESASRDAKQRGPRFKKSPDPAVAGTAGPAVCVCRTAHREQLARFLYFYDRSAAIAASSDDLSAITLPRALHSRIGRMRTAESGDRDDRARSRWNLVRSFRHHGPGTHSRRPRRAQQEERDGRHLPTPIPPLPGICPRSHSPGRVSCHGRRGGAGGPGSGMSG